MQDWKALEKYEGWLNTIEGSGGTNWRALPRQRMLATAQSFDDKDFQEAVAQVDDILRKRPHWSKAHYLQGEIAYPNEPGRYRHRRLRTRVAVRWPRHPLGRSIDRPADETGAYPPRPANMWRKSATT